MEYKYPDNLRFKIVKIDGVKSSWKFPEAGSCSNDCEQKGWLIIGEEATLKHSKRKDERFKYYLKFDSGLESDYFSDNEVEILMGVEQEINNTYVNIQKSKPPLGVMPKNIFELKRVQDLCRALYERSTYEEIDYELMSNWSEELNDRLFNLKCSQE